MMFILARGFPRFHTRVGRFAFASSSEGQHHVLQHVYSPSTPSTHGRKFSTRPALVTTFHDTAATFTSITLLVGDTIQITWSIPCTCPLLPSAGLRKRQPVF